MQVFFQYTDKFVCLPYFADCFLLHIIPCQEGSRMKSTPLEKQSKAAQREYHARQRGSWNGVVPVTRTIPDRKKYDRNRDRQALQKDKRFL